MRKRRNQALEDFHFTDEMPVCKDEVYMEEITEDMEPDIVRRVDRKLFDKKRRRIQSRKVVEPKEIDDTVLKALMRLSNAVEDVFSYEYQAELNQQKAITRKISKAARESKAKELFKENVLKEMQTRTKTRENRIKSHEELERRAAASAKLKARQEIARARQKKESKKPILDAYEAKFFTIAKMEEEAILEEQRKESMRTHAATISKKQQHREHLAKELAKLRAAMDALDSVADAAIHRRK